MTFEQSGAARRETAEVAHRRAYAADWAWFGPYEARLEELHHELTLAVSDRHDGKAYAVLSPPFAPRAPFA
jgi:hypothetical protein